MALSNLKVEVADSGPCERTLSVTIQPEAVRDEREKVLSDFRKKARIEGFRPGKAPRKLIAGRFAEAIKVEVLQNVINAGCAQALEQEKIQPLTRPTVQKVDLSEDDELSFVASVEVPPQIKLKRYTKFKVENRVHTITDRDVDEALENLRDRQARFIPKEGAAEAGDYLVIDFAVLDEEGGSQPANERKNQLVMAGHEDPTALFSHRLVGLTEGENQRVDIDFPEDYPDGSLQGKKVGYRVDVRGVRVKTLPELDDHFAAQVSPAENLEGLKELIRQNLQHEVDQRARRRLEDEIFRLIIEANPFDVPASLVGSAVRRQVENARKQYPDQQIDGEEIARIARPVAEFSIKREYLIREIAGQEKIEAAPADFEARIQEYAGQLNKPVDEVRGDFRSAEAAGQLRALILTEKVVQFLLENNDIKKVEEDLD
ncbi:MAG: trigger factor [Candidatus Glassbacteria bacterium]|nr:trigger factor [Candidatus Glassbacteria bacterium]